MILFCLDLVDASGVCLREFILMEATQPSSFQAGHKGTRGNKGDGSNVTSKGNMSRGTVMEGCYDDSQRLL